MKRFVAPAVLSSVVLVLHLAGGREATSTLAGIATGPADAVLGSAYVIAWLAFVVAVVPLVVTAVIARLVRRC